MKMCNCLNVRLCNFHSNFAIPFLSVEYTMSGMKCHHGDNEKFKHLSLEKFFNRANCTHNW